MTYTFKRPEITNIWLGTWDTIKTKKLFWFLLGFAVVIEVVVAINRAAWFGQVGFLPLILVGVYVVYIQSKIRSAFWREFAKVNGWQYNPGASLMGLSLGSMGTPNETGIMFKQGNERSISNEISGVIDGRGFRIFSYQFSTGSGKNRVNHQFTVFGLKFAGTFPHLYLNNKNSNWGISTGEEISLPEEFEKKFTLCAPKEYEIEALELFTPDVLANLLDKKFPHDVEFVNQEMLVFTDGQINNFDELEKEFNIALELEDMLDDKLDKFKYQQIGDMPSALT